MCSCLRETGGRGEGTKGKLGAQGRGDGEDPEEVRLWKKRRKMIRQNIKPQLILGRIGKETGKISESGN